MEPPPRPLQPAPPRGPETFGPIDVAVGGRRCALSVDGPLMVAPAGGQEETSRGMGCMCCASQPTMKTILISKADVIGAETAGETGVVVWYSPEINKDLEKPTRILLKTKPIECSTRLEAMQVVRFLRHWATWGGQHGEHHLVAIVNPMSGKQRGSKVFKDEVKPLLEGVCGYMVTCLDTKSPGHATTLLANMSELPTCSAVVVVGGDGTVHECLQGMLSRPDWAKVSKIPMLQLPTGSGNALAASTGVWDVPTGVHTICKGSQASLDVMSVVQGTQRAFSFMGLSYGAVSAVDKGTEHLRWMGETRFTVGGLCEIIKKNRYGLKMAYLPSAGLPPEAADDKLESATDKRESAADKHESASDKRPSSAQILDSDQGSHHRLLPDATSSDPHEGGDGASTEGKQEGRATVDGTRPEQKDATDFPGVPLCGLTPELSDWFLKAVMGGRGSVASEGHGDWRAADIDDVMTLSAMNIPWAATNYHLAPRAELGNGCMEVLYINKASRGQMLDFMLKAERGAHMDLQVLRSLRVSSLWLGPKARTSIVMADGEVMSCEPTYVEVHPRLCRVLVAK